MFYKYFLCTGIFLILQTSNARAEIPDTLTHHDGKSPLSRSEQEACSRTFATSEASDYVQNAARYRTETDRVSPQVAATREQFALLVQQAPSIGAQHIIVSIGEGFGRDIKYFRSLGLRAIGTDPSPAMVEEAKTYLGSPADFHALLAQDFSLASIGLNADQKLAGIWAMASLHHVPAHELRQVFIQMRDALMSGGIIHASFVMGVGEPGKPEVINGRFWSRIDALGLLEIVKSVEGLEIISSSGKSENDFFAQTPSTGFHFYNLWLRRK